MPRTSNAWYIPPSRKEIQQLAEKVGIKGYSEELALDLANLAAGGGEVLPQAQWYDELRANAHNMIRRQPDGQWAYPWRGSEDETSDRDDAFSKAVEDGVRTQQNICNFLRSVDLSAVPGATPMTKALVTLKLMGEATSDGDGSGGNPLPVVSNVEHRAKQVNDVLDTMANMDKEDKALLDADPEGDPDMRAMKLAEDMTNGAMVWLKVARTLNKLHKFRFARCSKLDPDPAGEEVRVRPIKSLSEMGRLTSNEWSTPESIRNYRMVTGAATMRERCERKDKKQLLFMIVDATGSMSSHNAIYKAGGVVMNRLKAVVQGEAELYMQFFTTTLLSPLHKATNTEEARAVMAAVKEKNFNGGQTSIQKAVVEAVAMIEKITAENALLVRPELVVVTDGRDTVDPHTPTGKATIHAFMVGGDVNDNLKLLAERTGGVGVHIAE